jgi:hypothetical protein
MIRYRSGKLPVIVVNGRKISSGDIDDPVALAEKAYRVALETSHQQP